MGWLSAPVIGGIVIGIVCIAAYAKRQLSMKVPVLNVRAFAIPAFRIGALLVMIDFGITLSSMYLLPQYIQNGMLLPVAMTGLIMLPGGVVNALVSLFAGTLYDKIGAKLPTRIGFLLSAVGAILLAMAGTDSSIGYVILCHVIIMIAGHRSERVHCCWWCRYSSGLCTGYSLWSLFHGDPGCFRVCGFTRH